MSGDLAGGHFATAALSWHRRYCFWQAFCLAKRALIGYTACEVGRRKLCHSFAIPIRPGSGACGGAEW